MIYLAIIISLMFLAWNILSEDAVVKFVQTRSTKVWRKWHIYDAVLRCILIPYIIFTVPDVSIFIKSKILFSIGVIYHIVFNLGFNYLTFKDKFRNATLKGKLTILLTLATTVSKVDIAIGEIALWLTKITGKEINYRFVWAFIIILEITLAILIWLWN